MTIRLQMKWEIHKMPRHAVRKRMYPDTYRVCLCAFKKQHPNCVMLTETDVVDDDDDDDDDPIYSKQLN